MLVSNIVIKGIAYGYSLSYNNFLLTIIQKEYATIVAISSPNSNLENRTFVPKIHLLFFQKNVSVFWL